GSAYVEQLPFLTAYPEDSITLECTLKQASCDRMYWYRQQGGRELEGLFYSYGDQLVNFTAEPVRAQRRNKKWDLNWKKLLPSDTAVYYCACSTAQ
uniref:Immunoglobulin V-set domain-containing protein n=1 Tax=Pelusios castaneus TaxID=367368 RepID=A0A8C8SD81_9SAUR